MVSKQITYLENFDDLELLIQGDVVSIEFKYEGNKESHKDLAVFYDKTQGAEFFSFLVPRIGIRHRYIAIYQAIKEEIKIKEGKIILKEEGSVVQPCDIFNSSYNKLTEIIKNSGLINKELANALSSLPS